MRYVYIELPNEFFVICAAMVLHNILKVSSANGKGMGIKIVRIDALTYLLGNSNIVCLQDAYLEPADVNNLMLHFPDHEILVNGPKTNSRGIAKNLSTKLNTQVLIRMGT